jgi:adenylylsulfate kinase-like enzyme
MPVNNPAARLPANGRLSVLWLCGPPGAGKSAAGWALYGGLARSGARAGFVDLGQLGLSVSAAADLVSRRW